MGVIFELPAGLVNQIAAGEVVERPASVLKELVENSLDAGAGRIFVVVEDSGSSLVRVQDDGWGMRREDLPKAFLRHATSKIKSYDDLVMARTLGFRGEALASIASVSRITIETRHSEDEIGTRMVLDPGKSPELYDWSGPVGTTISVRDLFFNVPVRRKYLKSAQTEQGHIVDTLSRLALGFHECQFDLSSGSRKILSLSPRSSPFLRILDLYPSFSEEDLAVHTRATSDQRATVFLLRPDKVRRDRQYQHLFINRRWIRHAGLFEAMTQGAAGRLSRDVHVGAWVYLDLSPDKLDVNVHPTKREVRFLEGDRLFAFVRRVVEESFPLFDIRRESHDLVPGSGEENQGLFPLNPEGTVQENTSRNPLVPDSANREVVERGSEGERAYGAGQGKGKITGSMNGAFSRPTYPQSGTREKAILPEELSQPRSFARLPEILKGLPSPLPGSHEIETSMAVLGQLAGTYLVFSWGKDLAIVDWHTAHERIRYERYRKELNSSGVIKSPLIFPLVYKVSSRMADALDNRLEELSQIGFDLDRTSPDSFRVRSVPMLLKEEDPVGILNELAEKSENFDLPILRSDRIDHILMTMSCHESVRRNDILDLSDGLRLVKELLETSHPYTCPHGRPTILRLTQEILNQCFGR